MITTTTSTSMSVNPVLRRGRMRMGFRSLLDPFDHSKCTPRGKLYPAKRRNRRITLRERDKKISRSLVFASVSAVRLFLTQWADRDEDRHPKRYDKRHDKRHHTISGFPDGSRPPGLDFRPAFCSHRPDG